VDEPLPIEQHVDEQPLPIEVDEQPPPIKVDEPPAPVVVVVPEAASHAVPTKPFMCPHCSFKSDRAGKLGSHLAAKHDGVQVTAPVPLIESVPTAPAHSKAKAKPFVCRECPFSADRIGKLDAHVAYHHKAPVETALGEKSGGGGGGGDGADEDDENVHIQLSDNGEWMVPKRLRKRAARQSTLTSEDDMTCLL
jgi:hypothetical protein